MKEKKIIQHRPLASLERVRAVVERTEISSKSVDVLSYLGRMLKIRQPDL